MDHQYHQAIYYNHNTANSRLPLTPNNSNSPPSVVDPRECPPHSSASKDTNEHGSSSNSDTLHDYPQEITWLFFRDNKWVPFQSNNHYKIEQAFTLGGIYVDIKDLNFPHLKSIRVFPTRMYLSYLGMKYRLSCVIQG